GGRGRRTTRPRYRRGRWRQLHPRGTRRRRRERRLLRWRCRLRRRRMVRRRLRQYALHGRSARRWPRRHLPLWHRRIRRRRCAVPRGWRRRRIHGRWRRPSSERRQHMGFGRWRWFTQSRPQSHLDGGGSRRSRSSHDHLVTQGKSMPSKQIAILIDTSGSMYIPASPGGPDKIERAIEGVKLFVETLIARLFEINVGPETEIIKRTRRRFAVSIHRFAEQRQVLPDAPQIDCQLISASTEIELPASLQALRTAPDVLIDQSANAAVVGDMTNLFGAVHQVADYLVDPANAPDWPVDHRVILLLSDGIQNIPRWGYTQTNYESDNGVDFDDILDDDSRNISLIAWGVGEDALEAVLQTRVADADGSAGLSSPNTLVESDPLEPDMASPFADAMPELLEDNALLPLRPVGGSASGYRWEQFTLPRRERRLKSDKHEHACGNAAEFEFESDEINEAILVTLVTHDDWAPSLELVAPSGEVFAAWTPGVRD